MYRPLKTVSLGEIALAIGCSVLGDPNYKISGPQTLIEAREHNVTFFNNYEYKDALAKTLAGACIIRYEDLIYAPSSINFLISKSPYVAWAKVLDFFYPNVDELPYTAKNTYIHETAVVDSNCIIEPGVFLGKNVRIKSYCKIRANAYIGDGVIVNDNTEISSGAVINNAIIGKNCIIHTGAKIGQDGFGFAVDDGKILKVKQLGRVIIHDNVEIGANTCIDRGALNDTIIGDSTKIDNLVQIAHNVVIGSSCFIAAQVGIAGSTIIGNFVMLGGQVGIAGHLKIGDYAVITAQSGVMSDVPARQTFGGYPAIPIKQWHRQTVILRKQIK